MTNVLLLVVAAVIVTWFAMRWLRSPLAPADRQTPEEEEIGRAKAISGQLERERDRNSKADIEGNKAAMAKADRAGQWVTDSNLNIVIPELLEAAQHWPELSGLPDGTRNPPDGATDMESIKDGESPCAAWRWNDHHWRIQANWTSDNLPGAGEENTGTYRVFLDQELVLDMTIDGGLQVKWIDALTVGPWVSDILSFAGECKASDQAISSASVARRHQDRADKIDFEGAPVPGAKK